MDWKLLKDISEYLQIIFATGYVGYFISQSGFREKENKSDLFYGTLVYGLFGYMTFDLFKQKCPNLPFVVYALSGVIVTIIIAILWRKWVKNIWDKTLHKAAISNEDNTPDVWTGIIQNTNVFPEQISVTLKNGNEVECDDVQSFKNAPFPLYYTDNEGNIALYITQKISADGSIKKMKHVRDEYYGDRLTYIPKDEIASVAIRFKSK